MQLVSGYFYSRGVPCLSKVNSNQPTKKWYVLLMSFCLSFPQTLTRHACLLLQEVIVVEDENGNIVRESMKDNDVLMQYRTMRETLIYLSHLSHEDTENQMLEKLRMQMQVGMALMFYVSGSRFSNMATPIMADLLVLAMLWIQTI
jgi:hypothetical protein